MGQMYKLYFPNGKSYVGISNVSAEHRYKLHQRKSQHGLVANAIRKYGVENIILTVLADEEWDVLCDVEDSTIEYFDTRVPNGYNSKRGGGYAPVGVKRSKLQQTNRTKDFTGVRFGRLVAIKLIESDYVKYTHKWLFKCDCGNEKIIVIKNVQGGNTQSCGCIAKESLIKRNTTHGLSKVKNKIYRTWKDIRARCNTITNQDYMDYGGRGISVSKEWDDFTVFANDMGDRPLGYSIDRIDVNGNYCKDNCRWASDRTQANNKRSNRMITIDNETKTLQEWSDIFGIDRSKARYRLNQGWPIEKVFSNEDFRK